MSFFSVKYFTFFMVIFFITTGLVVAESQKTLKLAAPLAFSGIAAEHSENMRKGIDLAVKDLKKKGWKIDLRYEDTTASAVKVVTSVKSLLSRGYKLFIGPSWSYMMAAVKPVLEQADAVAYGPATSTEVTGGPSSQVFHGVTKHSGKVEVVTEWLKNHDIQKAAIIVSDTGWGNLHSSIFYEAATKEGLQVKIVLSEKYALQEELEVIRSFVTRLRRDLPEAVLVDLNKQGAALLVKKMAEQGLRIPILGVNKIKHIFDHGLVDKNSAFSPVSVFDLPVSREFREKYVRKYNEEPGIFSDSSYDGVMILADATEATDGSPEKIKKYLKSKLNYNGVSGFYNFDADGNVNKAPWKVIKVN